MSKISTLHAWFARSLLASSQSAHVPKSHEAWKELIERICFVWLLVLYGEKRKYQGINISCNIIDLHIFERRVQWMSYFPSKARVKRRTSHEPNPIQPIRLMWSSAFDPIKFNWFYLERLRRSARLASREERLKTDFGSNVDFHISRTNRIINDNQS